MNSILIFLLFISYLIGEVIRISLPNGAVIIPIDVIVGITAVIFLTKLILGKRIHTLTELSLYKPFIVFGAVCLLSLLVNGKAYTPTQIFVAFLYLLRWISYALLYFFIKTLDEKNKKRVFYGLLVSSIFIIFVGYLQYAFYPNLRNLYYLGWDDHLYRMFSTFFDPNFAAVQFTLFFFLLLAVFIINRKQTKQKSISLIISIAITFIAILLTYSRAGYVMLATGSIVLLWLTGKKRYILILLLILSAGIFFIPKNLHSAGVELWRTASIFARSESAKNALTIIHDHPVFGVGFNAFRYAQKQYGFIDEKTWDISHSGAGTDSSLLFVLATTGVIGLIAYLYLLYSLFRYTYHMYKEQSVNTFKRIISVTIIASLVGLLVDSLFLQSLFYPFTMFWMWVLIGLL